MNDLDDLRIRTEDLRLDEIRAYFVETTRDRRIVDSLKAPNPVILEGSRGTGKSFLLRVAEGELLDTLTNDRVLPVYLSFAKSSLIHTCDAQQFHHWMLAKLSSRIIRTLYKTGQLINSPKGLSILAAGPVSFAGVQTQIDAISKTYEESYKSPGTIVSNEGIPSVDTLKEALEDICEDLDIRRVALFIDEAAHIFRPEQQRQFFTLFRDLRSPHISCNAAVYPGVTAYGPTFQVAHDATVLEINRNVHDEDYRESMWDIVAKQADSELLATIERQRENFFALAYAVSGNPRLLLKTVGRARRMNTQQVTSVLKDFYRTEIWSEHSGLADTYAGHRDLVDWGRRFIEESVIPDTRSKNHQWVSEGRKEATCYFWIHRDAPEAVKEALRLLSYTGIVVKGDTGIVATRGEIGTRYALNLGCLTAGDAKPRTDV